MLMRMRTKATLIGLIVGVVCIGLAYGYSTSHNPDNVVFDGYCTFTNVATFSGGTSGASLSGDTYATDVTLDDGVGASPSLIFKDGTDETATFSKANADYFSLATDATDGLNILVGNLKVGNGTPTVTLNGEDFYCEGTSEFDGAMRVDGAIRATSTLKVDGASTLCGNVATTGTLAAGATTITGACDVSGAITGLRAIIDTTTSGTTAALTAAQSGTVCVLSTQTGTAGVRTFTLPAAAAGLTYTFIDNDATAAADLWITAVGNDTINGGTAAKSYKCEADATAAPQSVTLVALDGTRWIAISATGTWANDNS